ncbi:MAG: PQQ-binding-like beta-propeller repeat protein [Planctomycetes bacterium]|nr:PQQ-binding-like beta-propeller repeat protein [Planctomycetota bacterium]MBL7145765.1 PQQ-binding-like beta-propeller repeat protein [Phycisphaerae bacterium]
MMRSTYRLLTLMSFMTLLIANVSRGDDWPTYNHDKSRSGITSEQLPLELSECWRFQSNNPPEPAWPPPAAQDFWHNHNQLRPTVIYDRAFHAVVVRDAVYFASSADFSVYALDAKTGKVRWVFFAAGPVRLAPVVAENKLYVGSDDGCVYCLSTDNGSLIWKFDVAAKNSMVPGNGRMISLFPVRTGLVVDAGKVFFAAGLFPIQGAFLFALDAENGEVLWQQKLDVSPQGYVLASTQNLYVPTGRTGPVSFSRENGTFQGEFGSAGGAYTLLAENTLVTGPGRGPKQLNASDVTTKETIATFGGLRMVVKDDMAYMQSEKELRALDRKKYLALSKQRITLERRQKQISDQLKKLAKNSPPANKLKDDLRNIQLSLGQNKESLEQCFIWKHACDNPYSLIMAGNTLFIGGKDEVVALSASDGRESWNSPVNGDAYGLSVANGRLFVCTDEGTIHCFSNRSTVSTGKPELVHLGTEVDPYPQDDLTDMYSLAAQQIVEEANIHQGYCLVLGCEEGRLAYEIAKRTKLQVIAVEQDTQKVITARKKLHRAGYYGSRITVHHGMLDELPYPAYFANLIVSESTLLSGELPPSATELYRVLRPCGGAAIIGQFKETDRKRNKLKPSNLEHWLNDATIPGWRINRDNGLWAVIRRGALLGSGDWAQLYADAAHTACSGDQLRGPMALQWFGKPGPRSIIDRHHRPMSSLVKDGRIFVPTVEGIICVDAYNGTELWQLDVPNSRRIGALKDSGHMLATDEYVYIAAEEKCWAVDVATGVRKVTLKAPQLDDHYKYDWGYLNHLGDCLVGTGQKVRASFYKQDFHGQPDNGSHVLEGDFRSVIVSDYLFAMDRHTGTVRWTYKDGSIMNSAITVGDGRIYFAECRNPEIMKDDDGRLRIDKFCEKDLFIIALDAETGVKIWQRPFQFPYEHIMFLNYAENTILFTGTYNKDNLVNYGLFAFAADTEEEKWQTDYIGLNSAGTEPFGTGGEHGEQWQHPVINGQTIYSRPYAFDLHTGEKKQYYVYRGGNGCGGLTGSSYYLYGRGANPRMYPIEVESTRGIPLTKVTRPGCWLNIIPAGGLILVPESSSGCTCGYSLQSSVAFAPQDYYSSPIILTSQRNFESSMQVELADRNGIGRIHYTLDGTEPNTFSPVYTGPITLTRCTTIKSITFWKELGKMSDVRHAIFTKF